MIIGIDAREICDRPAGKGQYLLRVIRQWIADGTDSLILYTKSGQALPETVAPSDTVRQVAGGWPGPFWHAWVASRLAADGVTAFFACLSYQSALWNRVPTVTVVHDMAVFKLPRLAHNARARAVETLTYSATVARSAALVAVSESTKRDMVERGGLRSDAVTVAYGAPLLAEASQPKPLAFAQRGGYVLFVGTLEPRKNIETILRSYAALPVPLREQVRLALAGKPGWGGADYPALADSLGIASQTDFLGYVSDAELARRYREANLLIFPSLYEGFGLPVAEALAAGTPAIVSDVSSLPEVVGAKGLRLDPLDHAGMAREMERLLTDPDWFAAQSAAALAQSRAFSWKRSADTIREAIHQVGGRNA